MREVSGRDESTFVPSLKDVVIPEKERTQKKLQNIFLIMEFEESDLLSVIRSGALRNEVP